MIWEIERHAWADIDAGLADVPALLTSLLTSGDLAELDRSFWRLDALLIRNQVLHPGAPEATSCMVQALSTFRGPGRVQILELVAQIAAGCVGPTAADPSLITRTVPEIRAAVPVVAELLETGDDAERPYCVDILDALADIDPAARPRIVYLLERYASLGAEQARRVQPVLAAIR